MITIIHVLVLAIIKIFNLIFNLTIWKRGVAKKSKAKKLPIIWNIVITVEFAAKFLKLLLEEKSKKEFIYNINFLSFLN